MTVTTLSSREFNQDVTKAKRAARSGVVFITDRGKPAHVLLSMEQFRRLTGSQRNLVDALAMPGLSGIDIEFPRSRALPSAADLA
jgi:prevent-host-death family protein